MGGQKNWSSLTSNRRAVTLVAGRWLGSVKKNKTPKFLSIFRILSSLIPLLYQLFHGPLHSPFSQLSSFSFSIFGLHYTTQPHRTHSFLLHHPSLPLTSLPCPPHVVPLRKSLLISSVPYASITLLKSPFPSTAHTPLHTHTAPCSLPFKVGLCCFCLSVNPWLLEVERIGVKVSCRFCFWIKLKRLRIVHDSGWRPKSEWGQGFIVKFGFPWLWIDMFLYFVNHVAATLSCVWWVIVKWRWES